MHLIRAEERGRQRVCDCKVREYGLFQSKVNCTSRPVASQTALCVCLCVYVCYAARPRLCSLVAHVHRLHVGLCVCVCCYVGLFVYECTGFACGNYKTTHTLFAACIKMYTRAHYLSYKNNFTQIDDCLFGENEIGPVPLFISGSTSSGTQQFFSACTANEDRCAVCVFAVDVGIYFFFLY